MIERVKELAKPVFSTALALGLTIGSQVEIASAETAPGVKLSHETDTSADMSVRLDSRYSDITKLCFTVNFDPRNPLEPGESYDIEGLGGWENGGDTLVTSRETCAEQPYQQAFLEKFEDGKEKLGFSMIQGNVDLVSVDVAVTGTPAK